MTNTKSKLTPEILNDLMVGKQEYIEALARQSGVTVAKERMKNLLFNYFDVLVQTAVDNVSLREEVASLEAALEESDNENAELKKSQKTKKTESKE